MRLGTVFKSRDEDVVVSDDVAENKTRTCIVMAYTLLADIIMAYIAMADIVMAYHIGRCR